MLTHVYVGTNDLERAKHFYDAVFAALGHGAATGLGSSYIWRNQAGVFGVTQPIDGNPATVANGGTVGFAAASVDAVNAAHDAGVAAGGRSIEDPPGWRGEGAWRMYLAYVRDPDGNKICLLHKAA